MSVARDHSGWLAGLGDVLDKAAAASTDDARDRPLDEALFVAAGTHKGQR